MVGKGSFREMKPLLHNDFPFSFQEEENKEGEVDNTTSLYRE